MKREIIAFATESEWLDERKKDITSTEAAALFGAGVYVKTAYELYHIKAGTFTPPEFKENDRTRWGNRLEDAIARGIAEDLGLIVEPFKVYVRIPDARMGSSFDFKIVGLVEGHEDNEARKMFAEHGPGIMEIKNVDSLQFKKKWGEEDGVIEAPLHIEFQVQWQMEVSDLNWAIIAPLVGGNTPVPVIRVRDRDAGTALREKAIDLWSRIERGDEPQPDFTKDSATIAQVYRDNDGSSIDLSDNERLGDLCRTYKKLAAEEKAAKEAKDAAKAEIMTIIKHAKSVQADGHKISAGTNKESFRCYWRSESERISISLSTVAGAQIEATVPAFRNVRISEAA